MCTWLEPIPDKVRLESSVVNCQDENVTLDLWAAFAVLDTRRLELDVCLVAIVFI